MLLPFDGINKTAASVPPQCELSTFARHMARTLVMQSVVKLRA